MPGNSAAFSCADRLIVCESSCLLCLRCFEFCPAGAIAIGSKRTVTYRAVPLNVLLSYLEKDRR